MLEPSNVSKLAYVEIASALAGLHRRYCAVLPIPREPRLIVRRRKGGHPLKPQTAEQAEEARAIQYKAWQVLVKKITRSHDKSLAMSACGELTDIAEACIRYRDWLKNEVEGGQAGDLQFEAAHGCFRDACELVSICRIAHVFPESAIRRAKQAAQGKKQHALAA